MLLLSDYVIPISGLVVGLVSLFVFCYVVYKIRQFAIALLTSVDQAIRQVFEASSEDKPSVFAEIMHLHALDIGQEVGQSFQRGITGSMGGSIKKANAEITEEMMKTNPQMAQQMAFNSMLPKSMGKNANPIVNMFMNMLFEKATSISGSAPNDGNHHNSTINTNSDYLGG